MRQIPGKIITRRLIGGNINLTNLSFHLWGIFKISKKEIDGCPLYRDVAPLYTMCVMHTGGWSEGRFLKYASRQPSQLNVAIEI